MKKKTLTLVESIKYIRERRDISNKARLEMYDHLCIVESLGLWKDPTFYKNSPYAPVDFIEGTWGKFISECYQESPQWFTKVGMFFSEFGTDTRDYIIEFGCPGCSTLLNCTIAERPVIIASWRSDTRNRSMIAHKYKCFPDSKRSTVPVSLDAKRFKNLLKQLKARDKQIKVLKSQKAELISENTKLRDAFTVLHPQEPEQKVAVK